MTLAQEYQDLLYSLFQTKLFDIKGETFQPSFDELPEEYIKKSDLIEVCISLLNELGKSLDKDKRLNNGN